MSAQFPQILCYSALFIFLKSFPRNVIEKIFRQIYLLNGFEFIYFFQNAFESYTTGIGAQVTESNIIFIAAIIDFIFFIRTEIIYQTIHFDNSVL